VSGEEVELPELFGSGRLTPTNLFDDIDGDRLAVPKVGATRPPMSDDSDSDAMGEESYFDLKDLERETDMVVIDMDRRDDWDDIEDRPYSPRATGVRDVFLSSHSSAFVLVRLPTSVSSGWAAVPSTSTDTSGGNVNLGAPLLFVVAAAGAERPLEFFPLRGREALAPVEHRPDRSATSMACVTSGDDQALDLAPRDATTSVGTEAYRPMTEPVSPYRAPTPSDRSPVTLEAIYAAMTTTLSGDGHQLARQLHEDHTTTLLENVTEILVAAMRYSRTGADAPN